MPLVSFYNICTGIKFISNKSPKTLISPPDHISNFSDSSLNRSLSIAGPSKRDIDSVSCFSSSGSRVIRSDFFGINRPYIPKMRV